MTAKTPLPLALPGASLVCLLLSAVAVADDTARVDFAKQVFPILRRACFECHGAEKQEAELRLDDRRSVMESQIIEAGKPAESELLRRLLLPRGHEEIMPAVGEPLPKSQIAILRRWIQQGAPWPDEFEIEKHWAYTAPKRPSAPKVSDADWVRSPIDAFVLRKLDQQGLKPSPPASWEKLVRRAHLQLIGLPPTPAELDAFLAAPSDQRFEELVDDLLRRPQFGERWARPWLDLARYADSHGFQRDNLRDVWAYRDWVIRAFNADMPFDQFTIEQIAGDLLPNATESQKIATGFHRCTPTNVEAGSLPEETRIEQVIDRVNTTGAVWLGTTLECCQCHDHKYDPFSQKDYYRLLAFFNNTQMEADRASKSPSSIKFQGPFMPLSDPVKDAQRDVLKKQIAELKQQRTERRRELAKDLPKWATEFSQHLKDLPQTHALKATGFESLGATDTFEPLDDGSILLVGETPADKDVYTVRTSPKLAGIRAFRLDVLRHDKLPGKGPGRGDPKRRNFVLNEFSVTLRSPGAADQTLAFSRAQASFSQKNWDVGGALKKTPKSGWAVSPKFDQSHWATFVLEQPLDVPADGELVFRLDQAYGGARTIGCFKLSALTGAIDAEAVPEEIVKAVAKQKGKWPAEQRKKLVDYRAKQDAEALRLERQTAELEKRLGKLAPATTLVMIELDKPRMSNVFDRGDYRKPKEPVEPGAPAILSPLPEGPPNRLTLARWLVDPANPLTARVTVNRWWAELFGQGVVKTVEDFGVKGDSPTHPELLDWLAVEFMENGWSTKKLLRTIVLSSTWRQSSNFTPQLLARDDQNRWLARGPRFRMNAEMIRDNALAVSGLLSLKQFGPSIRPYQPAGIWSKVGGTNYKYEVSPGEEAYRRGLYVVLKRGSPYPSFVNFDASARLSCTVKRSRTNTPLQALTLLNDPVYVEAAKALAQRILRERKGASLDDQLNYAFALCTARRPTGTERNALRTLYQDQLKHGEEPTEADAWYAVAAVLLNLHETITID